jgi:ElaB/YqjD/DUF883 family membrane-anchored ribosome-binding protein
MAGPYDDRMREMSSEPSRDTATIAKDVAREALHMAEGAAKAVGREAAKAARNPDGYLRTVEWEAMSYIREKPTQSVLMALAFGFIFGALRR